MESLDTAQSALELIRELPIVYWIAAAVVLALLIFGLRLAFKKPPAHLTAFSGSAGTVLVSRKALQELIRQACLTDEWVEAAKPTVKIDGAIVHTKALLRLASPENLKETSARIQNRISQLLQKSLNFDQIGEIQIIVSSFGNNAAEEAIDLPGAEKGDEVSVLRPSKEETVAEESKTESESPAEGEKKSAS